MATAEDGDLTRDNPLCAQVARHPNGAGRDPESSRLIMLKCMRWLTADEAADRLGVKVATVYAYVSRGVLQSWRDPGSRTSRFDPDEVEAVARRGRPRRATRPPALDFPIRTSLTTIGDHEVRYRGHSALKLARTATFEQVAQLLWTGDLGDHPGAWTAAPVDLPDLPAMDRVRMAVVLASAADPLRADLAAPAVALRAGTLITTMVEAISPVGDSRSARLAVGTGPPRRGTIAGRLWGRLARARPNPALVVALNAALVLLADHELAASALAARVAASTRADPYAVVLAGLGALSGPLHGGAPRLARQLLEAASQSGVDGALARSLETHRRVPGFGHPLYPGGDPRARVLLDLTRLASPADPALGVADRLIATVRRRSEVEPTIDLALAVLAQVTRMPEDAGEVVFTIARAAGWVAHAIEEYEEEPLRFRARAVTPR